MSSALCALALALATLMPASAPATARSLKWVPTNPDAPRPGPQAAALPQTDMALAEGPATPTTSDTGAVDRSGDYLTRMDTDRNGNVSLIEYQNWLSYAFDRMDANHDGVLTAEEQPGGRGAIVTLEAHRARVAETFRRQDTDHNGTLDARELAAPPQAPGR